MQHPVFFEFNFIDVSFWSITEQKVVVTLCIWFFFKNFIWSKLNQVVEKFPEKKV